MKAATTMFTSLFVLLASLKAVSGQFSGIPPCGAKCIEDVSAAKNCADTACVCADQSPIMTCIYRNCPVEDRAGSGYYVREGCSNASPAPAPAPSAPASSASSSAAASASSTASSSEEAPAPDASSTGAPATPGTPTTPATPANPAGTTAPPTRNLASPSGAAGADDDDTSSSRMVRSSSASRASTVVVVKTLGAGEDETGLAGGSATSVKAGVMGYAVSIVAMGVGALLL